MLRTFKTFIEMVRFTQLEFYSTIKLVLTKPKKKHNPGKIFNNEPSVFIITNKNSIETHMHL